MKAKIIVTSLVLLLFCTTKISAQEVLTIEDAMKIALENNFEIKIAKNSLKISETNVTVGNAGMLPRVNGVVTNNNTILNTKQTQSNGNEIEIDGKLQLVYPHQLEIVEKSTVEVEVLQSFFRGNHFLVEAIFQNTILYFESHSSLEKGAKVFLQIKR